MTDQDKNKNSVITPTIDFFTNITRKSFALLLCNTHLIVSSCLLFFKLVVVLSHVVKRTTPILSYPTLLHHVHTHRLISHLHANANTSGLEYHLDTMQLTSVANYLK